MKNKRILSIFVLTLFLLSVLSGCMISESVDNTEQMEIPHKSSQSTAIVQNTSITVSAYPVDLEYTEYAELTIPDNSNNPINTIVNGMPDDMTSQLQSPSDTTETTSGTEGTEEKTNVTVFRAMKAPDGNTSISYLIQVQKVENESTTIFNGKLENNDVKWDDEVIVDPIKVGVEQALLQGELEWKTCTQDGVYAHNKDLTRSVAYGQNVIFADAGFTEFQIQSYDDHGKLLTAAELSQNSTNMLKDGSVKWIEWSEAQTPVIQFDTVSVLVEEENNDEQFAEEMVAYQEYLDGLFDQITAAEQKVNVLYIVAGALAVTNLVFMVLLMIRRKRPTKRKKRSSKAEPVQDTAESVRNYGIVHNIGGRSGQQDSYDVVNCNAGTLAVVADGMGGLADGDKVSQKIVATMRADSSKIRPGKTDNILCQMVAHANQEVNRMLGVARQYKCGSTLLAVLVENDSMQWITVGDSRIYLYRGGKLIQINREHIYCAELLQHAINGKLGFAEAVRDPQADRLSSFIGMGELKHVDMCQSRIKLCTGDRILLMSDGVFNTLTDDEIADVITGSANANEAAKTLEGKVLQKKAPNQDNFTCVILEI